MMTDQIKSPGRIAYEADVASQPTYHDGGQRKTWGQLGDIERLSWERNPTPRQYRNARGQQ